MADPVTYTFYGTTIPVLRNCCSSAISTLTSAQNELTNAPEGKFPSEQELLDTHFADMMPLHMQPIMFGKFIVVALKHLNLHGTATLPSLTPTFTSLADISTFYTELKSALDAIDPATFNAAAEKGIDVPFEKAGKVLHMTGLADYFHGFVVPNAYFHLNAMYMLLRSKGFGLGKGVYVRAWMSETLMADWAPLRG